MLSIILADVYPSGARSFQLAYRFSENLLHIKTYRIKLSPTTLTAGVYYRFVSGGYSHLRSVKKPAKLKNQIF